MAQTTAAINGVNCVLEILTTPPATWTAVSGSANQVSGAEQRRMSGEAYTFDGDVALVKGGKREPVEVAFRIIYTEEAAEAWEIVKAFFEAVGGTACSIRWTPETTTETYTISAGVITRLQYPAADAADANPVVCEFSVRGSQITSA